MARSPVDDEERQRAWNSVRSLAMRDFSQDASLRAHAPTAIGSKSQPAGGIPMIPRAAPTEAHVMGSMGDFENAEAAVRFGFEAALDQGPSGEDWNDDVEERLRVDWERSRSQHRDWVQVRPLIRHGWGYGQHHLGRSGVSAMPEARTSASPGAGARPSSTH